MDDSYEFDQILQKRRESARELLAEARRDSSYRRSYVQMVRDLLEKSASAPDDIGSTTIELDRLEVDGLLHDIRKLLMDARGGHPELAGHVRRMFLRARVIAEERLCQEIPWAEIGATSGELEAIEKSAERDRANQAPKVAAPHYPPVPETPDAANVARDRALIERLCIPPFRAPIPEPDFTPYSSRR